MATTQEIIDLHAKIKDSLAGQFTDFIVIDADYDAIDENIPAPAIIIDMPEFIREKVGASRNLFLTLRYELYVCIPFNEDNAFVYAAQQALDIAKFVHGNNWGYSSKGANIIGANYEEFNPIFDAVKTWKIEFEQLLQTIYITPST